MTQEQQAQKLAAISRLTLEEIEGWRGALGKHPPAHEAGHHIRAFRARPT